MRQWGKMWNQEQAARAALRGGAKVPEARRDNVFELSLAEDGHTIVRTQVPQQPGAVFYFDELRVLEEGLEDRTEPSSTIMRLLRARAPRPCDTGAQEAAAGLDAPERDT